MNVYKTHTHTHAHTNTHAHTHTHTHSTMAGVGLQFEVTRNPRGVLVAIVTKLLADGPAAASGLVQVSDIVLLYIKKNTNLLLMCKCVMGC
jgi:hypothetical protein